MEFAVKNAAKQQFPQLLENLNSLINPTKKTNQNFYGTHKLIHSFLCLAKTPHPFIQWGTFIGFPCGLHSFLTVSSSTAHVSLLPPTPKNKSLPPVTNLSCLWRFAHASQRCHHFDVAQQELQQNLHAHRQLILNECGGKTGRNKSPSFILLDHLLVNNKFLPLSLLKLHQFWWPGQRTNLCCQFK